ncbi:hypothetical protein NDU88_001815 [Pleurodeles waltl]|uniref:Uncharacterized protein n=1 Tax=Pleurodeles waltl TaxID=8319 RepID=A0AAV7R870_PLEWA|nr:hypothetical protein NDU88_001815 [Pleurodeles waltl]
MAGRPTASVPGLSHSTPRADAVGPPLSPDGVTARHGSFKYSSLAGQRVRSLGPRLSSWAALTGRLPFPRRLFYWVPLNGTRGPVTHCMGLASSPEFVRECLPLQRPPMTRGGPPTAAPPVDLQLQARGQEIPGSAATGVSVQARPRRGLQDSAWFPRSASGPGRCRRGRPNRGARPQAQQLSALQGRVADATRQQRPAQPHCFSGPTRTRSGTSQPAPPFMRCSDCSARFHTGAITVAPRSKFWSDSLPHGVTPGEHRLRSPHSSGHGSPRGIFRHRIFSGSSAPGPAVPEDPRRIL